MKNILINIILLTFLTVIAKKVHSQEIVLTKDRESSYKHFDPKKIATTKYTDSVNVKISKNINSSFIRKSLNVILTQQNAFDKNQHLELRVYLKKNGIIDTVAYYLAEYEDPRNINSKIIVQNFNELKINNLLKGFFENYKPFIYSSESHSIFLTVDIISTEKSYLKYLENVDVNTKQINLSNYSLTQIPEELKKFKSLEILNLNNNYIQEINISKKDFPNLKSVYLQNNMLKTENINISNLKHINLNNNFLSELPKIDKDCEELYLANNYIKNFKTKKIKTLKSINLYNNLLVNLPKNIHRAKNIEFIDIYRNQIVEIPKSFSRLKKLQTLAASNNNIRKMPKDLSKTALKELYIHHNNLNQISKLPNTVEKLDVGYNQLTSITPTIEHLKMLTYIDFSNNYISESLDVLENLPHLEEVFYIRNPFTASAETNNYKIFEKLRNKNVKL